MKLTDLSPYWLRRIDDMHFETVVEKAQADGIAFLCPRCFVANGGAVGTHQIWCWAPHVPQTAHPGPGRWNLVGAGFEDLSLVAGSSSVQLIGGCAWHGFVRGGEVTNA